MWPPEFIAKSQDIELHAICTLLCTHRTHLLISYGKPISYYEQLISYGKPMSYYEQLAYVASCFQISMHGDLMFPNLHMDLPISIDPRGSNCIGPSSPSSAPSGSKTLRRVASGRSSWPHTPFARLPRHRATAAGTPREHVAIGRSQRPPIAIDTRGRRIPFAPRLYGDDEGRRAAACIS